MGTKEEIVVVITLTAKAPGAKLYENWQEVAEGLLLMGLTVDEAVAVMNSKWPRWAVNDYNGEHGKCPFKFLERRVQQYRGEVADLTAEYARHRLAWITKYAGPNPKWVPKVPLPRKGVR